MRGWFNWMVAGCAAFMAWVSLAYGRGWPGLFLMSVPLALVAAFAARLADQAALARARLQGHDEAAGKQGGLLERIAAQARARADLVEAAENAREWLAHFRGSSGAESEADRLRAMLGAALDAAEEASEEEAKEAGA